VKRSVECEGEYGGWRGESETGSVVWSVQYG